MDTIQHLDPCDLASHVTFTPEMHPVLALGAFNEGGELKGRVCVSRILGRLWIHDLSYSGKDKTAVLRLARAIHRQFAGQELFMNTTSAKLGRVLSRLGWTPVATTYSCRP